MKRCLPYFMIGVLILAPASAEEVPFAKPPYVRQPSESAVGTLANIMLNIQTRHIKLWHAGKAKNWDLLNYQAQKLEDDFFAAVAFYRSLPVDNVVLVDQPLKRLMEAARSKDRRLYARAFKELTAGCNSCHEAGGVGYIRIREPRSSPLSDQSYER